MTMTVHIHGVTKMTAKKSGSTEWLDIQSKHDCMTAYMPHAVAMATADAFNAAMAKHKQAAP